MSKWHKLLLTFVFISFLLVELFSSFTYGIGDEQVYFYDGKLVAEGHSPYGDFFFAHPPLQLYIYALYFKLFAYNLYILKIFFIILTAINAYLLYSIVKSDFNEDVALLATAIGLLAPTMLFNASFEYGLTVGMTFFLLGLKSQNNAFRQNLFFLLASLYRFHFIFLIIGYTIYRLATGQNEQFKRIVWFINWFMIVNGILGFAYQNYFTDTFAYHFNKPKMGLQGFDTIITVLKMNWMIFLPIIGFLIFNIKNIPKEAAKYIMIPLPFFAYIIKSSFFGYYFMLIIPFLAVVSALFIYEIKLNQIYFILFYFTLVNMIYYANLEGGSRVNLDYDGPITGDPVTVSYLALADGNNVMDNDVDNNAMLYESGIKNITYYITSIMVQHPLVIVKEKEGLYGRNEDFRHFLRNSCQQAGSKEEYLMFKC